jgi:pimeloyl-ACP methyl ester carboxylesterase
MGNNIKRILAKLFYVIAFMLFQSCIRNPDITSPESIVFAKTNDGVLNAGALFTSPDDSARSIVIIWIHGWGANFYSPTYVEIARTLAKKGCPCITANTRMHDIGFNIGETKTMRIRGGGYWGKPNEQTEDINAWINFAESYGFKKVILAGHSAGWAAVRNYQAIKQDSRVTGLILASGMVNPGTEKADSVLLLQAKELVDAGHGDDLLRIPNRRFPSFISAATFLDDISTPAELNDFFGVNLSNPGIIKINCPILAFFGTRDDVGTENDLELIKSSIRRFQSRISINTAMIQDADHMYTGKENQVAETIADWIHGQVITGSNDKRVP